MEAFLSKHRDHPFRLLLSIAPAIACLALGSGQTAQAAPGDLDPSFSGDGLTAMSASYGAVDVAVQPDGKTVVLAQALGGQFLLLRFQIDGNRDSSFGNAGYAVSEFAEPAYPQALAIQSDGKLVVAGGGQTGPTQQSLAIARFDQDGSLDSGFGNGGQLTEAIAGGGGFTPAGDIVAQPDGKLVVAAYPGIVLRYNADGSRDLAFAGDGAFELPVTAGRARLALQPDGKIVAADGRSLVRLNTTGLPDASFGTGGFADPFQIPGGQPVFTAVAAPKNGEILAGGTLPGEKADVGSVVRYADDGAADPGYAANGSILFPSSGVSDLVVESDGAAVLSSTGMPSVRSDFSMVRLTASGVVDSSFGLAGQVNTDFEGSNDCISALALTPGDGLIAVGTATTRAVLSPYPDHPCFQIYYPTDIGVARYQLAPGPLDSDGDGVLNPNDSCVLKFGGRPDGCPRHKTSVSLSYSRAKSAFVGSIDSPYVACVQGFSEQSASRLATFQVTVFRSRPGRDRSVGKAKTEAYRGSFERDAERTPGRYYALLASKSTSETGPCSSSRSNLVRLR